MITYRKQVSPNPSTPPSTSGYIIYQLDINSLAANKMADVEIIASLSTALNTSTIYYRKLQIIDSLISPDYSGPSNNSSFNYVLDVGVDLYLSEISYVQTGADAGKIQIKTTNPTGGPGVGTCFVHFKINFY